MAAEAKTYDAAAKSIDASLEKLGLDYIDLMLIHSPQPWAEWREENAILKKIYRCGKRSRTRMRQESSKPSGFPIFWKTILKNLIAHCGIKPMVNQLLIHIGNTPAALLAYCREQGIVVEAYSPIAHGEALKNETIAAMAQKYGASAAQLCIQYVLQLGTVALPKTANPAHMRDNANLHFELSNEDMERLRALDFKRLRRIQPFPVFSGK